VPHSGEILQCFTELAEFSHGMQGYLVSRSYFEPPENIPNVIAFRTSTIEFVITIRRCEMIYDVNFILAARLTPSKELEKRQT
jgi:hypothetical protein